MTELYENVQKHHETNFILLLVAYQTSNCTVEWYLKMLFLIKRNVATTMIKVLKTKVICCISIIDSIEKNLRKYATIIFLFYQLCYDYDNSISLWAISNNNLSTKLKNCTRGW